MVKDPGEVARMERAAAIADEALAAVLPLLAAVGSATGRGPDGSSPSRGSPPPSTTPCAERGAEDRAFETIVASGENSAKPHARPGGRAHPPRGPGGGRLRCRLRRLPVGHDPHLLCRRPADRGAGHGVRGGGRVPAAGVARVAPGVTAGSVDQACREVIAASGWAERFEHGTGHGVGLDIHEGPSVGPGSTAILVPGTVVTVEPGVYLPGTGGVRIEDTLVVTEHGSRLAHPVPEGSCCLMAVSTNDLRNGMTLDLPEGLFAVVEFQHVKPGKGGAFVRTKLKNQRTGAVIERTYRADEKLEQAIIDKREMQFLYRDGSDYVFMDTVVLRAAPGRTPASSVTPPTT